MRWYGKLTKQADWGHGDTLNGQMMQREFEAVRDDMKRLREKATLGDMEEVLPRWRGELRRAILLLPPLERVERMSMVQLSEVRERIDSIKQAMNRYNQNLFAEIMGE